MKKILTLLFIGIMPSLTHSMETTPYSESQKIQSVARAPKLVMSAMSPDRTKIVGVSSTGNVSLWDTQSGNMIDGSITNEVMGVQQYIKSVGFNKEGTTVIVTNLEGTEEYGIIDPSVLSLIRSHPLLLKSGGQKMAIRSKNISPDRKKIALLDETGNVSLWDARSGQLLTSSVVKDLEVQDKNFLPKLSFNREGTVLIVTSYRVSYKDVDPEIKKYDISSGLASMKTQPSGGPRTGSQPKFITSAISPDGTKIAGVSSTGNLSVWDRESGQAIDSSVVNFLKNVQSVSFNQEGTKVSVTSSEGTQGYDIIDPLVLTILKSHPRLQKAGGQGKIAIKSKSVSPDGTTITIVDENGDASLWDARSGKLLKDYM